MNEAISISSSRSSEQIKGLVEYDSLINLLDGSFHSMGQSLISEEIVLPLYISNFTSSKLAIGIIPFIEAFLFSFPQLFILSNPLNKFKSTKGQIIFFGILERLPWLILGILTLFINKLSPAFILTAFFFFYSIHILCWGCTIPLWFEFIREIIADHIKGSFFGTVLILKNIFGLIGGVLLSFLLNAFTFPLNFSYVFISAFTIMSISLLFFSLNKNPLKESVVPEKSSPRTISSLFSVFQDDTEFLFLTLSLIFSTMLFAIIPFFSLYAKEKFNMLDSSGGILTAIFFLGQTMGSILGGYLGNKHGYKKIMFLSLVFGMATIFIVIFAKTMIVYCASFFLVGFSLSTRRLSFLVYVMSASAKEKTPVYMAIINNVSMPFQISFPLLAGLVVEYLSYNTLFIFSLSFLILSFLSFSLTNIKTRGEKTIPPLEQLESYQS